MSQQPEPFIQKQAANISSEASAQLKQHNAACFTKYFSGEPLPGRGQLYQAELDTQHGSVKASSQHPLLAFLSTPKLPPELAQYLER